MPRPLAVKVAARYTQAILEGIARDVVSYSIQKALEKVKLGKHLKSVVVPDAPSDHFSDGKELSSDGDLGYAFTIHYPTKAVTTFSFEVDLQPTELEQNIRVELDDDEGISSEQIQAILKGIDTAGMFRSATPVIPKDGSRETSEILEDIEARVEVQQRTEAYSHDGPVELAEYPTVYLRWDAQPTKQELKAQSQGSGFSYKVLLRIEWDLKPSGWAFDADLRRYNKWHPLRLAVNHGP